MPGSFENEPITPGSIFSVFIYCVNEPFTVRYRYDMISLEMIIYVFHSIMLKDKYMGV